MTWQEKYERQLYRQKRRFAQLLSDFTNLVTIVEHIAKQVDNMRVYVDFPPFWSDIDDQVDLAAIAADVDLPNIVVPTLPTGFVFTDVRLMFKARAIQNTHVTLTNGINAAQNIRIKKSTGSWGTDDVAGINLADNQWMIPAATKESGDVVVGDIDIKGEVDGAATYNVRFEDGAVDQINLRFHDVQVGLKVSGYIPTTTTL